MSLVERKKAEVDFVKYKQRRKNYFDIEILMDFNREFKDVLNEADVPIISLQAYDTNTMSYFLFLYRDDLENRRYKTKVKGIYGDLDIYEFDFDNEVDMLKYYCEFCQKFDFDIHLGFNIVGFDFLYMARRFNNLKLNFNELSSIRTGYFNMRAMRPEIGGSVVYDLQRMMKGFIGQQREGGSLDALTMKFLGVGKLTGDARELMSWYKNNLKSFKEYSMIDVQLCLELDKKLGLTSMAESIVEFSYIIPSHVFSAGKCIEMYIFTTADKKLVYDNNLDVDVSGIPGAYVFPNPARHLIHYIAVVDFHRLYPNLIRTFNISPETIMYYNKSKYNEEEYTLLPNKKYMTFKKKKGIFPNIVVKLFELRDMYERKMKNTKKGTELYEGVKRQRQNTKDRVNAMSGMFDSPWSRFKSLPSADAVRGSGVYYIKLAAKIAEEHGYQILYGDTDSIFIKSKIPFSNGSKEEIDKALRDIEYITEEINKVYDSLLGERNVDHWIELGVEKIADVYVSIGKKKKYIMHKVWEDGEYIDKTYASGFEVKRSDTSDFAFKVQDQLFDAIGHKATKRELEKLVRGFVNEMKSVDPYKIGIPKQIAKPFHLYKVTNPWLEGAIYSNKYLNGTFSAGAKPRLLYIKRVKMGFPPTSRICIDINTKVEYVKYIDVVGKDGKMVKERIDGFEIDWDTMIDKNIIDKVDDVLELFGISPGYLKTGMRERKLSDWFGSIPKKENNVKDYIDILDDQFKSWDNNKSKNNGKKS